MHSELRPIIAKDQVRLGAHRALRLALSGMSYRMFRSGVTMAILALATAFLVHMITFGLLQQGTERHAFQEIAQQRQIGQMMTRLTEVDPDAAVVESLASEQKARLSEYLHWSGRESELASAISAAQRLRSAAMALSELPVAARAVLLGDAQTDEFLMRLAPERISELRAQVHQLGVRLPLGGEREFSRFLTEDLPRLRAFVGSVKDGHAQAIQRLSESFAGRTTSEVVRERSSGLIVKLRAAGFELSPADLADLEALESRSSDIAAINGALLNGEIATEIGRIIGVDAARANFDTVSNYITNPARARTLGAVLARAGNSACFGPERLLQLASSRNREMKISRALGTQGERNETSKFGLSERNQWLVALSFIVCIIGVANAMLMSVTERFTEIATMKCLGAMDGFIMTMFVFEAMIQGIVGGVIGLSIGVVLAAIRAAVDYGSLLLSATGVLAPIVVAMAFSLLVSVILAAAAAVGPSWLAARLSPMEAMRVE